MINKQSKEPEFISDVERALLKRISNELLSDVSAIANSIETLAESLDLVAQNRYTCDPKILQTALEILDKYTANNLLIINDLQEKHHDPAVRELLSQLQATMNSLKNQVKIWGTKAKKEITFIASLQAELISQKSSLLNDVTQLRQENALRKTQLQTLLDQLHPNL